MKHAQPLVQPSRSRKPRRALIIASYGFAVVLLFLIALFPLVDNRAPKRATRDHDEASLETDVTVEPRRRLEAVAADPAKKHESPAAPAPARTQAPESLDDLAVQLERRFAADLAPTGMMVEAQNTFASFFSKGVVAGAELLSVECRATTCRAQARFSGPDSDGDFFRYAVLDPKTGLSFGLDVSVPVRKTEEDGRVTATIFLFKAEPVLAQAEDDEGLTVEHEP